MKLKLLILCFIAILGSACSKKNKPFHAPEIGWTIDLINDWNIESTRKIDKDLEEGLEIIERSGEHLNISGQEIGLFVIRKNELTKFQATIIPFKETYENEWDDKYPHLKNVIYSVFAAQGVQVDSTSSKETIATIEFEVFNLKLSQNGRTLMEQNMYRTYLNGYDFIINMSHNSSKDKETMLTLLRASKFNKKD
ncbi:hypothetical protein [Cellulophaga sp. L1A9]|uniref:hypothetical protein n=1 Tax=Cellulophaga sp. L1A9 TaxID=2686362 RepID=UPI00131C3F34|nr:hypothetical protein [Cellulophaga sp. L1A9]